MNALLRISAWIDAVTEIAGTIARYLVLAIVAIGFTNVVARYSGRFIGARLTSNAWIEVQWYLYSIMFFLGFGYVLKHNVNVRVDFLSTYWSAQRRAWIDLVGTLLFLVPFCMIGIYATLNPVLLSWGRLPDGSFGTWEISPDPDGLPRAPIKSMIIVAFGLLLMAALSHTIKCIAIITGHRAQETMDAVAPNAPPAET
ncbi:MAG: TRAP transporter small permease subunit [Chloroflexi bacterium]|nr:TRAP transporter small permease subunit [Chloroflexota bacterium]